MPLTSFEERPESTGGLFLRLAKDGEQVTLRIIATPYKKSLHWKDNKPYLCGKSVGGDTCIYCEDGDERVKKPRTQYYYLSLIRGEKFEIRVFQTAGSVHWKLCDYKEDGYDIFETDWIIKRTGKEGSDFYTVKPTPKQLALTAEEKDLIKEAKEKHDLTKILEGGEESETIAEEKVINEES